jgi:hypothetical protein
MADDGSKQGAGRLVRLAREVPVQGVPVQEVPGQAGARPSHDRLVHACRASSKLAAQAGRAEFQRMAEAVPQPGLVRPLKNGRQLGARLGVRVLRNPRFGLSHEVAG